MDSKPFSPERLSKLKEVPIGSPAKINLFLQVTGKRDDGYHDINSLMVPITLSDEITFDICDGEGVTCSVSSELPYEIPVDESNLAVKAALLYLEETSLKKQIKIHINKQIPVGAGLGGGSSDAATVLCVLNDALGGGYDGIMSNEGLKELALEIGSDVPFFIDVKPAVARGRGEKLATVFFPEVHFVLINPMVTVSTAQVYSNLDLTKTGENNILTYSGESANSLNYLANLLYNDLEGAAIDMHPVIGELKDAIMEQGAAGSLMSGSGSTVFGIFGTANDAAAAYLSLNEKYKNFLVYHVMSIVQ